MTAQAGRGRGPGLGPQRPLLAIGLTLVALAILPLMDAFAKLLSAEYSVVQIVLARYAFQTLVLLPPALALHGARALLPGKPGLQVLRGLLMAGSTSLFVAAIAVAPLVDSMALFFVSPLFLTMLSIPLLGERVGWRRWSAVIVGFAGVLVVLRPGFAAIGPGALYAIAAGLGFAFYVVVTRKLVGHVAALPTQLASGVVGLAVMAVLLLLGALGAAWKTPDLQALALMAGIGAISGAGHLLFIYASERAPASLLAPYQYAEIIMMTVFGYLFFGEFPDAWTIVGIVIICAAGTYIAMRERRLARERRTS
ncbi:MAG: DMT family transporter [Alphaproteobacteria bacterium]|nr:DMT family transporter [Alphaproteobacteria bacterium]